MATSKSKKRKKNSPTAYPPVYQPDMSQMSLGGFFGKIGDTIHDYGLGVADWFTGLAGATDKIDPNRYRTNIGEKFGKFADSAAPGMAKIGAGLLGAGSAVNALHAQTAPQVPQPIPFNPPVNTQQTYTPTFKCGGSMRKKYQGGGNLPSQLKNIMAMPEGLERGNELTTMLAGLSREELDTLVNQYNQILTPQDAYTLGFTDNNSNYGVNVIPNPNYTAPVGVPVPSNTRLMTTPVGGTTRGTVRNVGGTRRRPYRPRFAEGGELDGANGQFVEYNTGQSHEGPDGGIPVDAQGQPSAMSGQPEVALTEKGEVTYNGYVFSDTTKLPGNKKRTFSDEAKRIKNRYKFYLGKDLDKKDNISKTALSRELEKLMMLQETIKGNTVRKEDAQAAMEQQAMQQQQMQQPNHEEQAMMEQQMMAEQMGGQPMMRRGGNLPQMNTGGFPYDADVRTQQQFLANAGFSPGTIDGIWGPNSQLGMNNYMNSVAPMQRAQSIPSAGLEVKSNTELAAAPSRMNEAANPNAGWQAYSGDISPWAMAPALIGSAIGLLGNKKQKDISLGRMVPEQINLEAQRVAARNRAQAARATTSRRLRDTGLTPGAYLGNMQTVGADIERNLGEQMSQSYLAEQTANAQARQQAQAANLQVGSQETMMNRQLGDMHRQQQLGYLGNMMNVPGQYLSDLQRSRRDAAFLNMMSPDYSYQENVSPYSTIDPRNLWRRPKFRVWANENERRKQSGS